jgi:hypothetical protein
VCKAFDYGTAEQRELMVAAVVPMLTEWSVHPQGRLVVRKAFDYGTAEQRELMVAAVVPMLTEWSVHPHGHKAVCKAFDYGTAEQRDFMVSEIIPYSHAWALNRNGAWSIMSAMVHARATQREALVEGCLPCAHHMVRIGDGHLLWEMFFSATASQHSEMYKYLLPLVEELAKGTNPRGLKTLSYLLTYGSKVQRAEIASILRRSGQRAQQCGNCGHFSVLALAFGASPGTTKFESCGRCSFWPSVAGIASGVAIPHGGYLLEKARQDRLLREYERLDPGNCTLHALKQLCRLAGATAIPTAGAGRTRLAIWTDLGSFIRASQI